VAIVTSTRHAKRYCACHFAVAKQGSVGIGRFRWFARIVWAGQSSISTHQKGWKGKPRDLESQVMILPGVSMAEMIKKKDDGLQTEIKRPRKSPLTAIFHVNQG